MQQGAKRCDLIPGVLRSYSEIIGDARSERLAPGTSFRLTLSYGARHREGSEEVQRGYQEMRGSARRCEEMRDVMRKCDVIRGDTKRFEEVRGWLRGMGFRFTFPQASLALLWQRSL